MTEKFDIVKLIEKNPITRLSEDYQNKLLGKIREKFTIKEQQLFVSSFYCYLKYNSKKDFVVDFENVWKWTGFSRKDNAKALLEKYFSEGIDYKILLLRTQEQNFINENDNKKIDNATNNKNINDTNMDNRGGHNKEQILITINTFKKFCMKANTKKADEIHDYYIKLEELLLETINEETEELRNEIQKNNEQLQKKDNQINIKNFELKNKDKQIEYKEKQIEQNNQQHKKELKINKHDVLTNYLKTKDCVYLGEIALDLIKIGSSFEIDNRGDSLKRTFGKCIYLDVFECGEFRKVEKTILEHPEIVKNLHREKINGHLSKEVVKLSDEFNYNQLLAIVKECIEEVKKYIFTPEQLLEKERLGLERQKWNDNFIMEQHKLDMEQRKFEIDFCVKMSSNPIYEDVMKDKLSIMLDNMIHSQISVINVNKTENINTKNNNIKFDNIKNYDIEINKIEGFDKYEDEDIKINKIEDSDDDMDINKKSLKKIKNENKIQQVDPNNLKKVVKVYDGMACVLRDPENDGFQKTSIQLAIKNNHLYKGYRWSLVKSDIDPYKCNLGPTVEMKEKKRTSIAQLNSSKTKIIDTFGTRTEITKKLKIGMPKMNSIIENGEKYSGYYYVELKDCPQTLLDNYDKPINKPTTKNQKQIKQINPTTKKEVIFNSLSDIYRKCGIADSTITKAIKNKEPYNGFLWEYYNNE
jgi:hypothetical protein